MARNGASEGLVIALAAGLYAALAWQRERRALGTTPAGRLRALAPAHIGDGDDDDGPDRIGRTHPGQVPFRETTAEALRRGRGARHPWRIPGNGWKDILVRTWQAIGRDHIGLIAAGVAFYGLLAIFPAIAVGVAVAGLVTDPQDFIGVLNDLSGALPSAAAGILVGQAAAVAGSDSGGLTLAAAVGLLLALYSASRGVSSLMEGLNVAYDETEKRGFLRRYFTAFALTLVLIAGTILGLTATIIIPAVLAIFGISGGWGGTIAALRWPILLVGTVIGLGILYRFGPSRAHARMSWLSYGALVACLLWLVGTAAFAWYAANFAGYNRTFGALGGAIVLLMWLWLSAFIVLIGAELNGEIEAQTACNSTTGPELPMGRRGAVKADVLGPPAGHRDG